ncbi:MAG: permease, partial [Bacteroidetes bacterium]|nr:permease [Bacteroidota bacterium]
MRWKDEYKPLILIVGAFLIAYFLPVGNAAFDRSVHEALSLLRWYAQEHVILCLIPAFFIAGVISVFVSQAAVVKYFGARAKRWLAYLVAAVSGTILAVCSCTVLPLFSGIHKRGAGLGPAIAFLYSGPAINILAIILTAKILGFDLGVARVIGAVLFSVIIGLAMAFLYRREESERAEAQLTMPEPEETRPLWQTATHFFILVAILVFANWASPQITDGFWHIVFVNKWLVTGLFGIGFALSLLLILRLSMIPVLLGTIPVVAAAVTFPQQPMVAFVTAIVTTSVVLARGGDETEHWLAETWSFAKQILPLLAGGVLLAGFFLGGPETKQGIIPNEWIATLVGGNSL